MWIISFRMIYANVMPKNRLMVANLVLSCTDCNRGVNGKSSKLPSVSLLQRLHERNEYLITSHHPLRETLIVQTGCSTEKRQQFLQDVYNCSITHYGFNQKWQPPQQGIAIFLRVIVFQINNFQAPWLDELANYRLSEIKFPVHVAVSSYR